MLEFIQASGSIGILICGLYLLNLGLVCWSLWALLGEGHRRRPTLEGKINAVLFWGALAAVLGVLGQANGIYLGINAILAATEINPAVVAGGFAVSFSTTIMGFLLLAVSALAWMGLRVLFRWRAAIAAGA